MENFDKSRRNTSEIRENEGNLYRVKFTGRSREREKRVKIERLRTPWVPAPAKSSIAGAAVPFNNFVCNNFEANQISSSTSTEQNTYFVPTSRNEINESMTSLNKASEKPSNRGGVDNLSRAHVFSRKQRRDPYQRHSRRPILQGKKLKPNNAPRRTAMQYTLQSKDSLVDVTACLQEKREEVMKLWKKNITKGDRNFLVSIEKANRLALEAAEEVEKLRRTIQDFQKKEDGLSDSDCVHLEQMRVKVLEKVKLFEEADNLLQENLSRQSVSKTSLGSATSKTSQTEANDNVPIRKSESTVSVPLPSTSNASMHQPQVHRSHSNHEGVDLEDVIILKQGPVDFSEESECENNTFLLHESYNDVAMNNGSADKSTGTVTLASLENLSHLKLLCAQNMDFPALQHLINLSNKVNNGTDIELNAVTQQGASSATVQPKPPPNRVRFVEEEARTDDNGEALIENGDGESAEVLYRDKISTLQRHLLNTEHEVEELKSEIERIESDANFRVRILQNSVQDKFESLQIIPEYLQMVDQKLNEAVQDKAKLLDDLTKKEGQIVEIKDGNRHLKKEADELRERLRKAENCKDFLSFKNTELEKNNTELRKQVDDLTKQIAEMSCKIQTFEEKTKAVPTAHSRQDISLENQKLKLRCSELKEELGQSKQIIHSLRKSKTKLVSHLNDRIEELLDALQHAQHHKHILGGQIRYLKKSYHELFPADMFKIPVPKKTSTQNKSKKATIMKNKQLPVNEPKLQSKVAWQTGVKLDDLLQMQIPR